MLVVNRRASGALRGRRPGKLNQAISPVLETLEIRRLLSAGDLDNAFGGTGYVTQDFGSFASGTTGAYQQSTGKLILAGMVGDDIGLARYLPNGTLDSTFDGDGLLTLDIASGDLPLAVKIRNDGKIVVAGDTNTDTTHIFAATLNDDGSLDTNFGGGIVLVDNGSAENSVNMVLSPTNDAYVVGTDSGNTVVLKFNSAGLDTTWGTAGTLTLALSGGSDAPAGIGMQSTGKLVIAGTFQGAAASVTRLKIDGSIDTDFGSAGSVAANPNTDDTISSIFIDSSDRILLGGQHGSSDTAMEVQRFTAGGSVDLGFGGGDGWVEVPSDLPGHDFSGGPVAVDGSGRVVMAGTLADNTGPTIFNIKVARFDSNGVLDPSFGTGGTVQTNITGSDIPGFATIDNTGKIVVAGTTDTALLGVRYLSDNVNPAPVADAGANQTVDEGDLVNFNGSGSTGVGLSYAWDLDGDGQFDDAFTPTTSFTYGDNGPVTVSLKVTDSQNQTSTDTALITVNNVAPIVDPIGGDTSGTQNQPVNFSGSFTDPGTLDTHEVRWDFGDGNVIAYHPTTDPGALSPTHTYTSSGPFTVTLQIRDDDNGVGTQTELINIAAVGNNPPVANAGADQTVNEGDLVNFDGTQSTGTGLSYAWDLDGDGQFDDAFTPTASFTYADNGPVTVSLQVTDSQSQISVDTASITVNNVAPTVNPITGPSSTLVRQQTASFSGSFSDPGTADTHQVSWDFGDGVVIAYHPSTDSGALVPTHTYTSSGTFVVTLRVKDDDNGVGLNTVNVSVVAAALQGGNLVVGGTDAGETIALATTSTSGQVKVSFNGVEFGRFIPTGSITVDAGAGADRVTIAAGVAATKVLGGAGNDTISGGNGNDTLDGGADHDSIDGNNGNDSLVGGTGDDTIIGGNDNDISRGGDGNDLITNNGGDDLLDGGIGNDTLNAGGGADTAIGGDGNDSIVGGTGDDSLFGGNDNDTITGGAGFDTIDGGGGNDDIDGQGDADIIVGGSGNDTITGGADRDILIGGTGADSIVGNADEDILIAGNTDHDGNTVALVAIQTEWLSGHTYAQRIANIRNGSGGGALNGAFFFNPDAPGTVTVHDDAAIDTLTGSGGNDWYLFNNDVGVHDIITDLKPAETASDID